MYHYNPSTALEELTEDATLPNPVHVREMMLRHKLSRRPVARTEPDLCRIPRNFSARHRSWAREILKRLAARSRLTWGRTPSFDFAQDLSRRAVVEEFRRLVLESVVPITHCARD
jgi:hypothetical protein